MLPVSTANRKSMGISIEINRSDVWVPQDGGWVRSWGSNVKYPYAAILYSNQVTNLLVKLVKSRALCVLDQLLVVGNTLIHLWPSNHLATKFRFKSTTIDKFNFWATLFIYRDLSLAVSCLEFSAGSWQLGHVKSINPTMHHFGISMYTAN